MVIRQIFTSCLYLHCTENVLLCTLNVQFSIVPGYKASAVLFVRFAFQGRILVTYTLHRTGLANFEEAELRIYERKQESRKKKKENTLSTKKPTKKTIKKKKVFSFFLSRFLCRERVFFLSVFFFS